MARAARRPTMFATADAASELAEGWTDEILRCRSRIYNHQFLDYVAQLNQLYNYIYIVLRCDSCGTKKHYEISTSPGSRGMRLGPAWYTYPPGYQSRVGRIVGDAQDAVRAVALERLVPRAKMTKKQANEANPRHLRLVEEES